MNKPYLTPSAVIVLLLRRSGDKMQVLCQRRINTGFADGLFDFSCAGKVEQGESMTVAVCREVKEELGVSVDYNDLRFLTLVHKCDEDCNLVYYNGYFACDKFNGEPTICEPEKCSELKWFDVDDLPDDLIDDRKCALKAYLDGIRYIEYGWKQKR